MEKIINNKYIYRLLIIFVILFILLTLFFSYNSVYGKVNETYGRGNSDGIMSVERNDTDSSILRALSWCIYDISEFVEKIISYIMEIFTGDKYFPYSDSIIFNSIRFLDINFFSPSEGSLFLNIEGSPTVIGTAVKTIYYLMFTLAISFLGIIIAIIAIKLVFSAIAAEKAKYKEAIKNWIFAIFIVFSVHYIISFIFWINENMVEIACNIFIEATKDVDLKNEEDLKKAKQVIIAGYNDKVVKYVSEPEPHFVMEVATEEDKKTYEFNNNNYTSVAEDVFNMLINEANQSIKDGTFMDFDVNKWYDEIKNSNPLTTEAREAMNKFFTSYKSNVNYDTTSTTDTKMDVYMSYLAEYFKINLVDVNNDIRPMIAILYAIFIVQSLLFLVSYVKRLFYIITLALFSPVIVIYDLAIRNLK